MNNNFFIQAKNGNREAIEFVIKTVEPFIFKQCRRMKLRIMSLKICVKSLMKPS